MTDDEITDVSAWLISQRPATPGQPYPSTAPASGSGAGQSAGLGKEGLR
jgi:hypothetical protein